MLQARLIAVRRLLLLGRLDEAASALVRLDARFLTPSLLAVADNGGCCDRCVRGAYATLNCVTCNLTGYSERRRSSA